MACFLDPAPHRQAAAEASQRPSPGQQARAAAGEPQGHEMPTERQQRAEAAASELLRGHAGITLQRRCHASAAVFRTGHEDSGKLGRQCDDRNAVEGTPRKAAPFASSIAAAAPVTAAAPKRAGGAHGAAAQSGVPVAETKAAA